jgi:hypothetical protein
MERLIDDEKLKSLLKDVLVELLEEKKELFYEIVLEALEEAGLIKAIEEGRDNSFVPEDEIMKILDS